MADENREIFREKVKFRKFSTESGNLSKIGGNMKQGRYASWPQGDGRPWLFLSAVDIVKESMIQINYKNSLAELKLDLYWWTRTTSYFSLN